MTVEERLKNYINARYSSVLEFCETSGIPNSTLQTVFKRGIKSSTGKTIFKICDALSLDPNALYAGEIKTTKPKKKSPQDPEDVIEYIAKMETAPLTFHGEELTEDQKKTIVLGAKIAVGIATKSTT